MVELVRELRLAMPVEVAAAVEVAVATSEVQVVRLDDEPLTDQRLEWLGQQDGRCRFERGASGELIIMSVGRGGGPRIAAGIIAQIWIWIGRLGSGEVYDGTKGYDIRGTLLTRIPDVSWLSGERLAELPSEIDQEGFTDAVPEFAVEILSDSQAAEDQIARVRQWVEWGARVGWMIDPFEQTVDVVRAGRAVEHLERPELVEVGPEMPGLVVDFSRIWRAG